MSLNGLTSSAGLKLGPLVLETLVKHYFERLKIPATTSSDGVSHDGKQGGSTLNNNLRQEELLYDQAFTIVKVSTAHALSPRLDCRTRVCGLRGSRAPPPICLGCASWLSVADPRSYLTITALLCTGLLVDFFSVSWAIVPVHSADSGNGSKLTRLCSI